MKGESTKEILETAMLILSIAQSFYNSWSSEGIWYIQIYSYTSRQIHAGVKHNLSALMIWEYLCLSSLSWDH